MLFFVNFLCICALVCALAGKDNHLFVYICAFVRTGEKHKHLSESCYIFLCCTKRQNLISGKLD